MKGMLADLPALRRRLSGLREAEAKEQDKTDRIEALVECAFRIAVHPETEGPEALDLLSECARSDGTHPRYAYHLARAYFAHGELDKAQTWIERAARQCPRSHRIWSHVCLLQWELNLRYSGDGRFEENALKKRANAIAESVQDGLDAIPPHFLDFQPPESLAEKEKRERQRRQAGVEERKEGPAGEPAVDETFETPVQVLTHPGTCRWSGIHDLLVEQLADWPPKTVQVKVLRQLLKRIADLASTRPGGIAAFSVTGIQWILSGYSVSTVRRLAKGLIGEGPTLPSLELLDLVCRSYVAEIEEVPRLLADALEDQRIPPALAAIVHRRRVLWRSLAYPTLVAYRDARRLLADSRRPLPEDDGPQRDWDDEAQPLVKKLISSLDSLDPEPPKPLAEPDVSEAGAKTQDGLSSLEDWAKRQSESLNVLWGRLKALATAEKNGNIQAQELEEVWEIQATVEEIFSDADEQLKQAATLRESGKTSQEHRGLERLDATEKRYQTMLGRKGPFRGKFAAFGAGSPSPPVKDGPTGKSKPEARIEGTGLAALAQAMALTDRQVTELFENALATFDFYSGAMMEEPSLRALRQSVRARQAETLHRMGRRTEARRVFSGMVREDPVDPGVLKSLAVCNSSSEDTARAMGTWRSYAEVLYFLDVVETSPRPRARARRELHQALGGGYAPPFLLQKLDQNWQQCVDPQQMLSFLSSPGRVRIFVEHKLLEFLNAQLEHRSPLLRLGVTREEGEEARHKAAESFRSFLEEVREQIPARVRSTFSSLVETHVQQAEEACKEPRRLLQQRDVHYADDRDRHIKVLVELVQLKYKLFAAIGQDDDSVTEIPSIGVFAELARLDHIPITQSREMATAAAGSVGGMTGEVAQGLMKKLLESAIMRFLDQLFDQSQAQEEHRSRQYRRLIEDLSRYPSLEQYRAIFDDPQSQYPDVVLRCLKTHPVKFTDEAIQALENLNSRFPEISGLSRLLAHGYSGLGKRSAAVEVLGRAAEIGLSAEGRDRCSRQMGELLFEQAVEEKDYAKAGKLGLGLLADDDGTPTLAKNVIVMVSNAAHDGRDGPSPRELESEIDAWLERAQDNPDCPEESLADVKLTLESSLLQMVVARAGGTGEPKDWGAVLKELNTFEVEHPGMLGTCFYRMMAHFQLGAAATHDPSSREAALGHLRSAKEEAERLVGAEGADESQREQAMQVLGQVAKVL